MKYNCLPMNPNPNSHVPIRSKIYPKSQKAKFTSLFLKALARINRHRSSPRPTQREIILRSRRIKLAADNSMASIVGHSREWSRAILGKDRYRSRLRRFPSRRIVSIRSNGALSVRSRKNILGADSGQVDKLRSLVPGGAAMDLSCLLDESAHYVKSLSTQVQVMKSIADFLSSSNSF